MILLAEYLFGLHTMLFQPGQTSRSDTGMFSAYNLFGHSLNGT